MCPRAARDGEHGRRGQGSNGVPRFVLTTWHSRFDAGWAEASGMEAATGFGPQTRALTRREAQANRLLPWMAAGRIGRAGFQPASQLCTRSWPRATSGCRSRNKRPLRIGCRSRVRPGRCNHRLLVPASTADVLRLPSKTAVGCGFCSTCDWLHHERESECRGDCIHLWDLQSNGAVDDAIDRGAWNVR